MQPIASVIVPTYNQCEVVKRCIESLLNQTADPSAYEIIVTDDGSTDGTAEAMKELERKARCRFRYLWHENFGRSRNRNIGVKAASGQYLIFVDGDMIVLPQFVEGHLAGHKRSNLVVNGVFVNVYSLEPDKWPKKIIDFSRAFFATGNVSVEREIFIAAGLFNEDFKEYGWEDLELGIRLKRMGLTNTKAHTAGSYHYQNPLNVDNIPSLIRKEKERGHTAVLFSRQIPTLEVRMMTLNTPIFFVLDRMCSLFNWPERPGTIKFLKRLQQRGHRRVFNLIVALIKNHAYADGLREELAKNR